MTNRDREGQGMSGLSLESMMKLALLIAFVAAGTAQAADEKPELGEWQFDVDLTGKYVGNSKSTTSFRQDHNIQSGAELGINANVEWKDNRTLEIRGFGQSGEEQGYFVSDYDKLGQYGLVLDFSSWQEFYNARTGRLPETSAGRDLDDFFPGTNDGREFFGGGSPSTDWMRGGFLFDYQPSRYVSNVYADMHFRRVDGDQTLAKSGAIFTSGPNQIFPGATGLVDFAFPSQKEVDYQSYLASSGANSDVGITPAWHRQYPWLQ